MNTKTRWLPAWVAMVVVVLLSNDTAFGYTRVRLVGNGYEGVVVGVSEDVKEEDGPALIEALKAALKETSLELFRATNRRAYFRTITILVPRSWSRVNLTHQAGSESIEQSDIKVDDMSPVYIHQPYTKQPGGCGEPGLYIHLTPTYLMDDNQAKWYGLRGKALLLEWAKYRWGVFDELGYARDSTLPLFYRDAREQFTPTLCSNQLVPGRNVDKRSHGACEVDRGGSLNENCRFIPSPNQKLTSSLLSYIAVIGDEIIHFCGGSQEEAHETDAPTKQNLHCDKRSAWDVISNHEDFKDGANPPTTPFQPPNYRVVQQADANYALVLDYSGSMSNHDRVYKLRGTARRWLLHQVAIGSYVAIINFSNKATLIHKLTRITDENSRKILANAVEIKAEGGTSIGSGLKLAAKKVLDKKLNPVILLITDGEETAPPLIDQVLDDVLASGARVVTVAFGAKADPGLERIAELTGGKTFTVNDVDEGQMLEDAFQGALTFQPPPPAEAMEVTIHEMEYQDGGLEASATFNVDFTVGRNLTLRLEIGTQAHRSSRSLTSPQVTQGPSLVGPNNQTHTHAQFDTQSATWTLVIPMAEVGEWRWQMGLSGERDKLVRIRVTSLPRDPHVIPITTRAWFGLGAKEVNASVDKVTIFAEVRQGNNPVTNADVRALVTPPEEREAPEIYHLLDNGQGADILAGDGIYSRYMTKYPSKGRYSVKAQVTDGGTAQINTGFLTASHRRRRREIEEEEEKNDDNDLEHLILGRPEVCCGSMVPLPPDAPPTGPFQRTVSGGSFKVTSVTQGDIFAPIQVRDLEVRLMGIGWARDTLPTNASVTLSWTAPGDDMDGGIVSGYELRMATEKLKLFKNNKNSTTTTTTASSSSTWRTVDLSGLPLRVEGGQKLHINLSLTVTSPVTYFALRAWDDEDNMSLFSNTAVLRLSGPNQEPSSSSGVLQLWVVVVVVVIVVACMVVVVVVLCLAWRKRQTACYSEIDLRERVSERERESVCGEER